jgi:hypothetical protein
MTATLIPRQTAPTSPLTATLELAGLQTYDREPGSDEWDDALAHVVRTVTDAIGDETTVSLLSQDRYRLPDRCALVVDVGQGRDGEVLQTLIEALTDDPLGVEVTHAALTPLA